MPDDENRSRTENAHIWTSFGLCVLFWVLPLEANALFGLSYQYGFAFLAVGHLVLTTLILAPIGLALRDGVPLRRLFSSLRVLFVLLMAVAAAGLIAVLTFRALQDGTLLVPRPR